MIHASAPLPLLTVGRGTDTAIAEHGATLVCATNARVRVSLSARTPGLAAWRLAPAAREVPLVATVLDDLMLAAGRCYDLTGLTLSVTALPPVARMLDTAPALAVAITAACATHQGIPLAPHTLVHRAYTLLAAWHEDDGGLAGVLAACWGGAIYGRYAPFPRVFVTPLDAVVLPDLESRLVCVELPAGGHASFATRLTRGCHARLPRARTVLWQLRGLSGRARDALSTRAFVSLGAIWSEQTALIRRLAPDCFPPEILQLFMLARRHRAYGVLADGAGRSLAILVPREGRARLATALTAAGFTVPNVGLSARGVAVRTGRVARVGAGV